MSKYAEGVKFAFQTLSITTEEDEILNKANTLTATNMFRATEGLPLVVGSKGFEQDDFIGIEHASF